MTTLNDDRKWSQLLHDKVIFITGAAGGIGSSICRTCILHGARVVISGIRKASIDDLMAEIIANRNGEEEEECRDRMVGVELDIRNEKAIQEAIELVINKWGRIDALVNVYVYQVESLIRIEFHLKPFYDGFIGVY